MSEVFHKSCYTARSTGYKYRTLSTNTGEKKRRDSLEDNTFERKLKDLKKTMNSKIQNEVDRMADAREAIIEKFKKVDTKIDSLIELHKTVLELRESLTHAENALAGMFEKVNKIEKVVFDDDELYSLHSRKSSFRSQLQPIIFEEKEIFQSNITHL